MAKRWIYLSLKLSLAASSAAFLLVTLVLPQWVELLLGESPDKGNGTLEWSIVCALLLATLTFSAMVCSEWRNRVMVKD